jgi:actin related protein 2/3 complex, subunit 1A/1B
LDGAEEKSSAVESGSAVSKARELFKNKTSKGVDSKADGDVLKTKHERPITGLANATPGNGNVDRISTSSMDGKLIVWNLPSLSINLATLGI